jgi:phosphoglycerate dehydrogenase-like enzyme
MKVLLSLSLDLKERHIEQIGAVSDAVEVLRAESEGEALELMPEVDVVLGSLSKEMFLRGDRLRWVQATGAGVNGLLYPELVDSDVILTSAKGIVGVHLADHAMALLLTLTRGIMRAVRKPSWDQRAPIRDASWELLDQTMGIVGLGGTGRALAVRADAFGMRVIAVDPEDVDVPGCVRACWKMDRFLDLLSESDVVAVCAPLTPETEGIFNREAFRRMRRHAVLINVTRGRIVQEEALLEALEQGLIGGAGLDVTPQEPLPEDHPLWRMENVVVTPHTAGGSPVRLDRTVGLFCENLKRLLASAPLMSVIDKSKGY